jgi:hypothetical protein
MLIHVRMPFVLVGMSGRRGCFDLVYAVVLGVGTDGALGACMEEDWLAELLQYVASGIFPSTFSANMCPCYIAVQVGLTCYVGFNLNTSQEYAAMRIDAVRSTPIPNGSPQQLARYRRLANGRR